MSSAADSCSGDGASASDGRSASVSSAAASASGSSSSSSSSAAAAPAAADVVDEKSAKIADSDLRIGKPIFALKNPKSAEEFNEYRQRYRSFRVGAARGAKGEVSKFLKPWPSPQVVPPFLTKLYDMLSCGTYTDLICWSEDGKSIVIQDIKQFSKLVLPQYFKHDKFTSFLRQLNMYNFYTTRQEPDLREFRNPNFVRQDVNLMTAIKRKRTRTSKDSKSGSGGSSNKRSRTSASKNGSGGRGGASKGGSSSSSSKKNNVTKLTKTIQQLQKQVVKKNTDVDKQATQMGQSISALKKQLSVAVVSANAARAKCLTLQRTINNCNREIAALHRKTDGLVACVELLCRSTGASSSQLFKDLLGPTEIPSPDLLGMPAISSHEHTIDGASAEFLLDALSDDQGD